MLVRAVLRIAGSLRAGRLLLAGRHDEARALCQRLLRRCPGEPRLLYLLGRAHFGQKDYLGAFFCLSSALHRARGKPLPEAIHYFRGVSAYCLGRLEPALESLEHFRSHVGKVERHVIPAVSMAKASVFLGYAHLKAGDPERAAELFEEVLRCGGAEDPKVAVDLATIYCSEPLGRYRDAVRVLEDALERFPQEVELLKGLSYVHSLLDEDREALRYGLRVLRLCPEDRWAHQQLEFLAAQRELRAGGTRGRTHLRLVERLDGLA
jgi:tetratricopeptide (TPR) repeat protein